MRFLSSLHIAIALLLVTIGVGLYVDWQNDVWHQRNLQVQLGLERMVRLNQSLTGSVAMAAAEQNPLRAASYSSLQTELAAVVADVTRHTQHMSLAEDMQALLQEQAALRNTEAQAFLLMRKEQWTEAYALLLQGNYGMALKMYEINSESVLGALSIELANDTRLHQQLRHATLVARLLAVGLLLWASWHNARRLQADLAEQKRLRTAVSDANQALEAKVLQRTTELEQANQQLATLSATDGLTGLANRRALDAHIQAEWQRALRNGSLLAVVMVDVDVFKSYNDHYGHPQGDECLRQVAQVLKAAAKRSGELAARYGGEEFLVVLPHLSEASAREVAQDIRRGVEVLGLPHAMSQVATVVTVSLGVACTKAVACNSPEQLLHAADAALYHAKNQGRNRLAVASELEALTL